MQDPTTLFILGSVVLFAAGIVGGWLLTRDGDNIFVRSNLQIAVGIIVAIVWVVSIAAEIIIPAYTVSVLVHGIMGAVVGYLFSEDGIQINIGGTE